MAEANQQSPSAPSPEHGRGPSYKLTLAYDGAAYAGWQLQPDQVTVQEVLEQALEPLAGRLVRVQGSGRTDSGVHALGQVASFDADLPLPEQTVLRALNARLPRDVQVLAVRRYDDGFHAIKDTVGKRYRYSIQDGPLSDVFLRGRSWRIPLLLDERAMAAGAARLEGRHDFKSFEAAGAERKTSVRHVTELAVVRRQPGPQGRVDVEVEADGFLYNMVRILVGTLVEIGKGKQGADWAAEALRACRRDAAGPTAPPQGLFLMEVRCRK